MGFFLSFLFLFFFSPAAGGEGETIAEMEIGGEVWRTTERGAVERGERERFRQLSISSLTQHGMSAFRAIHREYAKYHRWLTEKASAWSPFDSPNLRAIACGARSGTAY